MKLVVEKACPVVTRVAVVVSMLVLACGLTVSQQPAKPEEPKPTKSAEAKPKDDKKPAKPTYKLTVNTEPILNLSLKAEKTPISEIAEALSKRMKTPVLVSPNLKNEVVSVEFRELTLEPALQLLAPQVYVDYEILTGSVGPPKALGIFLFAANQGEPPLTAVVTGNTESLLFEGDTEDGVEPKNEEERKKEEEKPLRVQFENNYLSVKAKKQPLTLVLLKIGEELGIPVDIQDQPTDMVDTEISKLPVEDVVRRLSPNIRLFLRADLTRAERRALRLVLTAPAKTGV